MKKVFAVIIALGCLVQFACKKKSNNSIGYSVKPPKGLDTLMAINAKVNGQDWRADSIIAYKLRSVIDSNNVNLTVTATKGSAAQASTITFTITNYKGPATYTVDPPYTSATYYSGTARHYASGGQVVISSDNAYGVIGVFNFNADTVTVTEGVFNAAQP